MNIRLKRIIKIGLPLIIFLINICSAAEENIISNYEKKIEAVMTFAFNKHVEDITAQSIKEIDNLDSYLEIDLSSNTYKVKEDKKDELLSVLISLMDKQPKIEYFDCLPECNIGNHLITLPTCQKQGCKYAFYNDLLCKLLDKKNKIPCLLTEEPKESKEGHLCFFSLGEVFVDGDNAFKKNY